MKRLPVHCWKCKKEEGKLMKFSKDKYGNVQHICRMCNLIRRKKFRRTLRGRSLIRAALIRTYYKNYAKSLARSKVSNALALGKIIRPSFCENCLNSCKPSAHHNDYSKPLKILWLCKECHLLADKQMK